DPASAIEPAKEEVHRFADLFEAYWLQRMREKLGLFTEEAEDRALVDDLLAWTAQHQHDFTNTFGDLTRAGSAGLKACDIVDSAWRDRLAARRTRQPQSPEDVAALMHRANPAFIPRNHKVEEALYEATGGNL